MATLNLTKDDIVPFLENQHSSLDVSVRQYCCAVYWNEIVALCRTTSRNTIPMLGKILNKGGIQVMNCVFICVKEFLLMKNIALEIVSYKMNFIDEMWDGIGEWK